MIRGQRFEVDLGDDNGENRGATQQKNALPGAFVGDVLERKPTAATPPSAPKLKSKSGFPEHRKRNAESRFKQRNAFQNTPPPASSGITAQHEPEPGHDDSAASNPSSGKAKSWEEEEKERIDAENRQKLARMSPDEIEEERQELMNSLSPALVQRLLQRSNIESGGAETDLSKSPAPMAVKEKKTSTAKSVSFAEPTEEEPAAIQPLIKEDDVKDQDASATEALPHDTVHFPRPPQPPDLDPSSETFLTDLHAKYFPSLPSEPEKLEWMQQPSNSRSQYDPTASSLKPKDLRFSFQGALIPPKLASKIPVTAGLHHHGSAPEAAGYTISELAHLSHSAYPAQRCIAFQTLGRILFRLGRGEFGDSGEPEGEAGDSFGELARGLWAEVEREKVVEGLVKESEGTGVDGGRHVSAKAYATEAVWLWQRGGGRRWKAE